MTRTAKARMTEAELAALADALAEAGETGADRAEAAAAALDAALAELGTATPPLDPGLLARMEAAAVAPAPARTVAASRPARDPRLAGAARRRPGLLTRIGAPAAFAASAAMGVALGYSGDSPLADSIALLTTGYSYETAFLQADFLPDPDLPALPDLSALEETR